MKNLVRLRKEVRDMRDHLDSWCADDFFEYGVPPTPTRRAALAVRLAWLRLALPLMCALRGHHFVDHDPGNPEVGPAPDVFCERCFRQ